ncbi:MAG TPA: hypothetical protein VLJ41_16580 [Segetibacter sp.]|nr:hypothetical protein [Segetibacter sp.]
MKSFIVCQLINCVTATYKVISVSALHATKNFKGISYPGGKQMRMFTSGIKAKKAK